MARFGKHLVRELPGVRNDGPNFQFHGDARGASFLGDARGVVAQAFVGSEVNKQWRKTGQVGIERRRKRIARIGSAEIVARTRTNVLAVKHGAARGVRADGFAGGCQVGPRREQRGCGRKRRAGRP